MKKLYIIIFINLMVCSCKNSSENIQPLYIPSDGEVQTKYEAYSDCISRETFQVYDKSVRIETIAKIVYNNCKYNLFNYHEAEVLQDTNGMQNEQYVNLLMILKNDMYNDILEDVIKIKPSILKAKEFLKGHNGNEQAAIKDLLSRAAIVLHEILDGDMNKAMKDSTFRGLVEAAGILKSLSK